MGLIMLIYDPAQDPSNYVFRLLRLMNQLTHTEVELDKYRIIDFYLMFPSALASMRLPDIPALKGVRQQVKSEENRYNAIRNPRLHFMKVENLQLATVRHLVSIGILDADAFEHRLLKRTTTPLGVELDQRLTAAMKTADPISRVLLNIISTVQLLGKDGLKARSKLMEHKYDTE